MQSDRYYGYCSNVSWGKRKKQNQDKWIPCILEPDESLPESRKNWARLIRKIYQVDPLTCPRCSGKMKVISVIEDEPVESLQVEREVIKKILKHLGLWEINPPEVWRVTARPPPKADGPQPNVHTDYSDSQVPASDKWLYVDPEYPETFST